MAVAPTAPPTKSPSSSPEAPRRRRVLHWVVGVVGTLAFVLVAWVFPAVYHDRYDPATKAGATPAVVDDPAWHPVPTPEQDQVYLQQTRTSAAHPGAAVEGRDGFLFLGDDYMANFAQAMGRRYYSREEVQTTVDAEKNRDAWLAKRGIASELFVVPAKWSIYPDKLPAWTDGQVLPHVLDQLVTADAASFPDLRPALKQARSTADTYSKLNSHWTQYGAYVGFQAIAAQLQKDHPEVGQLAVPTLSGTTTVDANNEFAAITGAPGPNNWTQPTFAQPLPSYTVVKPDGSRTTVPGTQLLDITQMPLQTESSAAGNNHRALILADSATTSLSPYLAHAFGTTMMVRHWMDVPTQAPNLAALVESFRPDVVITLLSERNLNIITPDAATWQAATAYDNGKQPDLGSWKDGSANGLTLSGRDLGSPVTAALTTPPTAGLVVRLDVDATAAATVSVSGTASTPFERTVIAAAGHSALFVTVPPGLADGTLTMQRNGGTGTLTVTSMSVRALP